MKQLVVYLCEGCMEMLNEYNPYIDKDGNEIPIEDLEIIQVDVDECDNTTFRDLGGDNK